MKRLPILLLLLLAALPAHAGLDWICKAENGIIVDVTPTVTVAPCDVVLVGVGAQDFDWWYYPDGTKVPPPDGMHEDEVTCAWSSSAPGFVNPGNVQTFFWEAPSDTPDGTYTFTVEIRDKAEHGGDDQDQTRTVSVTVHSPLESISGPGVVCNGAEAVYSILMAPFDPRLHPERVPDCVKWTCTGGAVNPAEGPSTTVHWTDAGIQAVTAKLGGKTVTMTVEVKEPEVTGVNGPDKVCVNETACFVAEGNDCLEFVEWSGGGEPDTFTGSVFCTSWSEPGTYVVGATGGALSGVKIVTVNPPELDAIEGPAEVCAGETACFSATFADCGGEVTWSGGGDPAGGEGGAFCTSWTEPGTYTVTASVEGGNDLSQTVTVKAPELDAIAGPTEVCPGETACFSATFAECTGDVTWTGGEDPAGGEGDTFCTSWSEPGTYTVTASVEGGNSVSVTVTVKQPQITGIFGPLVVCPGEEATFSGTMDQCSGPVFWTGGGEPSSGYSETFTTFWTVPGTYTVTATIGASSRSINVVVKSLPTLTLVSPQPGWRFIVGPGESNIAIHALLQGNQGCLSSFQIRWYVRLNNSPWVLKGTLDPITPLVNGVQKFGDVWDTSGTARGNYEIRVSLVANGTESFTSSVSVFCARPTWPICSDSGTNGLITQWLHTGGGANLAVDVDITGAGCSGTTPLLAAEDGFATPRNLTASQDYCHLGSNTNYSVEVDHGSFRVQLTNRLNPTYTIRSLRTEHWHMMPSPARASGTVSYHTVLGNGGYSGNVSGSHDHFITKVGGVGVSPNRAGALSSTDCNLQLHPNW